MPLFRSLRWPCFLSKIRTSLKLRFCLLSYFCLLWFEEMFPLLESHSYSPTFWFNTFWTVKDRTLFLVHSGSFSMDFITCSKKMKNAPIFKKPILWFYCLSFFQPLLKTSGQVIYIHDLSFLNINCWVLRTLCSFVLFFSKTIAKESIFELLLWLWPHAMVLYIVFSMLFLK